jgi:hypothetical protein
MTNQNILPAPVPIVKSVALAIFIILAISALTLFCPFPVTKILKPSLPDLEEIIPVNVSLGKTSVDIRAGRDGSIN